MCQDTQDDEKKSKMEKLREVLNICFSFISWLPLILTSLLYKVGSVYLYMKFFGFRWALFGMFIGILLLNISCSLLIPRMKLKNLKINGTPEGTDKELALRHWFKGEKKLSANFKK